MNSANSPGWAIGSSAFCRSCGGVFVAGSLLWAMAADGFRPDRWDVIGAVICLVGVAIIMYAPASPEMPAA